MTKFVKNFLVFIILGLLFSGKVYAADCNQASGDITGTEASPDTTTYVCEDGDVFVLDEGVHSTESTIRINLQTNSAENVTITNSGTIYRDVDNSGAILGATSDTVTLTNNSTGTIQGVDQAIFISSGDNWTVDNYGTIYGEDAKAINIKSGDNNKITNRSGGTIKTDGANGILIWGSASDDGENTEVYNYGTISAAKASVKVANTSSGTTITNYSGGSILATNTTGETAALQIDSDNTTITNKGTITASGTQHSIEIKDGVTGTKIYVDGAPTFTGEVDFNNAAANTTVYLGCSMTQDTTIEIHNKPSLNITNNLCGNDAYTIQDSSQVADSDNSETNGYIVIDEGLEVESNNAKYRSENVSTKLKGLFSAANYIDGVEPEDKFFRVFYSNVKREDMYEGSMKGIVGQLSPINWRNITSNVFLGYSEHHGDFDNGEFLGGGNYALGLKNVFTKNGLKVSFSPMIGLNSLDVTDFDSDSSAKIKTNLLSEFLAFNGKIDKEIQTSKDASLNLSVQSTLGLQRFPDYLSSFSDGDLSVDEAIEQVLSGGFEVKYNEKLGGGFIIKPYIGVTLNHNLNSNIDMVKDDDNLPASPAYSSTAGYYAGLSLNKKIKDFNFDLDLMYGNEEGLINEIAAISLTKKFSKVKTAKLEKKTDTSKIDLSSTTEDRDNQKDIEALRKAVEQMKTKNEALKAQNEKLKLLSEKVLEENKTSKNLIMDLIKANEKIKLEKEILKNQILEKESEELREKIQESNKGNKPSLAFLGFFGAFFTFVVLSLASLIASAINRIFYKPVKV